MIVNCEVNTGSIPFETLVSYLKDVQDGKYGKDAKVIIWTDSAYVTPKYTLTIRWEETR